MMTTQFFLLVLKIAADFFGPRALNSSLGDRVFPAALAGKSIQLLGNVDLPHCYSYIGDVARGLALLGERDEALGRVWHIPVVTPVVTQRDMAQLIGKTLDKPVHIQALPRVAIQAIGLCSNIDELCKFKINNVILYTWERGINDYKSIAK